MNVFYVLIRTTENYEFDKIRTAGVTGNATNYKNSQGDNPIFSTRDEISQPSRPISPRAGTGKKHWIAMVFNENANYDFILLRKQGRTQLIYSTEHVFENFGEIARLLST